VIVHPLFGRKANGASARWPVRAGGVTGRVGSFGETRRNSDGSPKMHRGIDWLAPVGSAVYAAHDGRVQRCGEQSEGKGYGQRIYLYLDGTGSHVSLLTIYAHLCVQFVSLGEVVRPGHCIGRVGRSGNVADDCPDHLHFEVREGDVGKDSALDPEWWLHERMS